MRKILALCIANLFATVYLYAQIDAGLFHFPDVSKNEIIFSYANDLWIVPKEGGTAIKLVSPPGVETYPKFSPDGRHVAFTGNYDGNKDVYVLPITGGVPLRITEHGYYDRVVDWTPDGKSVLFASTRESGKMRFNQFYTIPAAGGAATKLPLAYAEYGSYSPDGNQIALTFRTQVGRNWKRYRGGWKADIYIFDLKTLSSTNISSGETAGNEFPMWRGNLIYFISDRGSEKRMNLWCYHTTDKSFEQLTHFTDYDVHFPSMGPDDIVFENGGKLYLFGMDAKQLKEVKVNVVEDDIYLKPKLVNAEKYIDHANISPDGNRVLIEARGDLFSLPAENGFVKDLTQTSGIAERYPSWSPDGKTIAFWSDQSGEYELWMMQPDNPKSARKLTDYGAGFRYSLYWSPDSKKLAFIDKAMHIQIYDIETNQTTQVDKAMRFMQGGLENFSCSWSPDSRWVTYFRDLSNQHNAVFIYDYKNKALHQVTDGFYSASNPVFDTEGKYLYLLTSQSFNPSYSDLDNTFIYANSTQVAAISLRKDVPSLLYPKNDTVAVKEEKNKTEKPKEKEKKGKKEGDKKEEDKKPDIKPVDIDFDGFESRMVILPAKAGNYGTLAAVKGKILYMKLSNTGETDAQPTLKYFDTEKREEKNIISNIDDFLVSADGLKLLVRHGNSFAVIKPEEGQKMDKPLHLNEMTMMVNPKEEWQQIFTDAWRLERDYFYDPNMHGVDWNAVRVKYAAMLKGAMTREDVDFIIGEMIGELSSSHTYHGGGDLETEKRASVGYLGVNWEADGKYYRIKEIIHGAPWDATTRSPLSQPDTKIKEGDYILAVNGVPLTTEQEPFAAFQDLANKTVELTYNSVASWTGAKTAIVQTMADEYRLRNLAWIESNRKQVEKQTNGEVGYIYVPSTGVDGQNELMRQFNAQWDKKGLIIDERFNDGGQIPDRFIEMLNRKPYSYWATRDGASWPWPPYAHFGPKVMLINGWSGSGGDAFPYYFRERNLGPLIGARTWGGLIGISGYPKLIDGGSITAPSFRLYNLDGTWFKEGHGVDPDIDVEEDLGSMAKGIDPQLERAITEIKNLVIKKGFTEPKQPPYEKR
ncbi:MAG: PD40 domain-containing protein [Bacteroidetes bacterium]|nr:PD40 domain-containing protein [Bacteroidota bacterium]